MMTNIVNSPLMVFLNKQKSVYYGKVIELVDAVSGWLSYIPQTFPHYTRHTLSHSEQIILQVSKLLFDDNKGGTPVVNLSPAEAYILIASALLHDAGMVVSDKEKATILSLDEWNSWTSDGGAGANRWNEINAFRNDRAEIKVCRDFIADIQVRFLIAEFLRRTHHLRAANVIVQHQATLGRFAFDDPVLLRTISDVCVAHGLRQHELDDNERFPDRRDIRGDTVNVKFMAILLRIGDLLDISCDRACPLLLNAACPLPPDSLAHWTQYQRIVHRLTAPDRIAITAECETQEEHQYIQDWCQWLVEELHEARFRMARSTRHNDWVPPRAELEKDIIIRPNKNATYIPSRWVFELDKDAVLNVLIRDAYANPNIFIRELIQNSLDASRCQMFFDITQTGVSPPEYLTQVDEQTRGRYPLKISLEERSILNSLSGENECRQVLIINDCGIGMDRDIIQRYFLQVGRSFYTTDEFKRNYNFIPTSRFGIGFLSVFAASDLVTVETYKPRSADNDGAIRLTLTGPRNYLLTDRSDRRTNGTKIEVLLRESLRQGALTEILSKLCRKVEFPLIVDDLGTHTTIRAERPDQFTYEIPDVTEEGAKFVLRSFPINRPGIEGDLYVFARITEKGESWSANSWAEHKYPKLHPAATAPHMPPSNTCLHGITINYSPMHLAMNNAMICRIDYRCNVDIAVARDVMSRRKYNYAEDNDRDVQSRWEELICEHMLTTPLASGKNGWKYKQRLVDRFVAPSFWLNIDGMIPLHSRGGQKCVSLDTVRAMPKVTTITDSRIYMRLGWPIDDTEQNEAVINDETVAIKTSDMRQLSIEHRKELLSKRYPANVRIINETCLAIDWIFERCEVFMENKKGKFYVTSIPSEELIGIPIIEEEHGYECHLLNNNNNFVKWLVYINKSCQHKECGLSHDKISNLIELLISPLCYKGHNMKMLATYVDAWRSLPGLNADLYPPEISFNPEMFKPAKLFNAPIASGITPSIEIKKRQKSERKRRPLSREKSK